MNMPGSEVKEETAGVIANNSTGAADVLISPSKSSALGDANNEVLSVLGNGDDSGCVSCMASRKMAIEAVGARNKYKQAYAKMKAKVSDTGKLVALFQEKEQELEKEVAKVKRLESSVSILTIELGKVNDECSDLRQQEMNKCVEEEPLKTQLEFTKSELEKAQNNLKRTQTKLDSTSALNLQLKAQVQSQVNELEESGLQKEMKKDLARVETELSAKTQRLTSEIAKNATLRQQNATMKKTISQKDAQLAKSEKAQNELSARIAEMKVKTEEINEKNHAFELEIDSLNAMCESLKEQNQNWEAEVNALAKQHEESMERAQQNDSRERESELESRIEDLERLCRFKDETIMGKLREIDGLKARGSAVETTPKRNRTTSSSGSLGNQSPRSWSRDRGERRSRISTCSISGDAREIQRLCFSPFLMPGSRVSSPPISPLGKTLSSRYREEDISDERILSPNIVVSSPVKSPSVTLSDSYPSSGHVAYTKTKAVDLFDSGNEMENNSAAEDDVPFEAPCLSLSHDGVNDGDDELKRAKSPVATTLEIRSMGMSPFVEDLRPDRSNHIVTPTVLKTPRSPSLEKSPIAPVRTIDRKASAPFSPSASSAFFQPVRSPSICALSGALPSPTSNENIPDESADKKKRKLSLSSNESVKRQRHCSSNCIVREGNGEDNVEDNSEMVEFERDGSESDSAYLGKCLEALLSGKCNTEAIVGYLCAQNSGLTGHSFVEELLLWVQSSCMKLAAESCERSDVLEFSHGMLSRPQEVAISLIALSRPFFEDIEAVSYRCFLKTVFHLLENDSKKLASGVSAMFAGLCRILARDDLCHLFVYSLLSKFSKSGVAAVLEMFKVWQTAIGFCENIAASVLNRGDKLSVACTTIGEVVPFTIRIVFVAMFKDQNSVTIEDVRQLESEPLLNSHNFRDLNGRETMEKLASFYLSYLLDPTVSYKVSGGSLSEEAKELLNAVNLIVRFLGWEWGYSFLVSQKVWPFMQKNCKDEEERNRLEGPLMACIFLIGQVRELGFETVKKGDKQQAALSYLTTKLVQMLCDSPSKTFITKDMCGAAAEMLLKTLEFTTTSDVRYSLIKWCDRTGKRDTDYMSKRLLVRTVAK